MEEKFTTEFNLILIRKLEDALHIITNLTPQIQQLCQQKEEKVKWLDGQQVAQLLNISKRTLQNMRDRKKIGYYQISGKFFYKYDDIVNMMKKSYQPPVDQDNYYLK